MLCPSLSRRRVLFIQHPPPSDQHPQIWTTQKVWLTTGSTSVCTSRTTTDAISSLWGRTGRTAQSSPRQTAPEASSSTPVTGKSLGPSPPQHERIVFFYLTVCSPSLCPGTFTGQTGAARRKSKGPHWAETSGLPSLAAACQHPMGCLWTTRRGCCTGPTPHCMSRSIGADKSGST